MSRKHVKVPLILQMESVECGAAALGMILAYYGRYLTLEKLREDCGVSRDGSKALYLQRAAKQYGLSSKIFRASMEEVKNEGSYPCILFWKNSHFVVLCGFQGKKAIIMDPASGKQRLSMAQFCEHYSNVVLYFSKGEGFVCAGKPQSILEFAKKRLTGSGSAIGFVALCSLVLAVAGIITPIFSRLFVDYVLVERSENWLYVIAVGMAILIIVKLVLAVASSSQQLHIESYFAIRSNSSFLWHILRLPVRFFQYRHTGDIVTRQGDNENIAYSMIQQYVPLVLNSLMIVLYIFVLFRYNVLLALVGIATAVLNIAVMQIIMRKSLEIMRVAQHDTSKVIGSTYACVEQIETIKASGAERGFFRRWAGYQSLANEQVQKQAVISKFMDSIMALIVALSNITVIILGAYLIIIEQFTPGMLMAFQGLLSAVTQPITQLSMAGRSLQTMRVQMERTEDIFRYEPDVAEAAFDIGADSANQLSGDISISDVSFGYNKLESPLLTGFDLQIRAGEHIAIVGKSGCGKSTFTNIVAGLYKPWTGSICFDGQPIDEIDLFRLRSSLSVVSQENHLFSDTIEENIRMWDQSISFDEVVRAATDAQIHPLISKRKLGYKERLIDGGIAFSGGQRQQIEIARALAGSPTILIMDEATSAMDAQTEADVLAALKKRSITLIMVAHRLSTVRDCDRIIVLDDGKITEVGSHEELISKGGVYTRLVNSD